MSSIVQDERLPPYYTHDLTICMGSVLRGGSDSEPYQFGRERLPVRDIPARSPSAPMAIRARSHGSGLYRVDARAPAADGRDTTAVAVLTIDDGVFMARECVTAWQLQISCPLPAGLCLRARRFG